MKNKITLSLFVVLLLIACTGTDYRVTGQADRYLIHNVQLIDVTKGKVIPDQRVLIEDGQIKAILSEEASELTTDTPRKDGGGGFLMPGLIDMHVHGYDPGAFQLTLSHGVTHVRVMNGTPEHLSWRDQQASGTLLSSSLTVSSPIIHSGGDWPLSQRADTAEQARALVHEAKQLGYDLLKVYGSMNAGALTALIEEASAVGLPVAKHGPHPAADMSWEPLRAVQSLEHTEDIYQGLLAHERDFSRLPEIVHQLKALNVPITPTLNIFWQLTRISDQKQGFVDQLPVDYISPVVRYEDTGNQVKRWLESSEQMAQHNRETLAFLQHITAELSAAGIELLVGSDSGVLLAPHGLATLNEMRLMHQSGLTRLQVIQAATLNAARTLGRENEFGQLKPGTRADLLLLKHNPLEDLSALDDPFAVIKGGIWLDPTALSALRESAISNRSLLAELLLVLNN